jgi:O-methyltransferase
VWVADSFQGLPPPKDSNDGWDLSEVEHLAVSIEQVKANFEKFGLLDDQVKFLKGWFKDTLPQAPVRQLAILRMDGDLYTSTMDVLSALYDKVSPGGYIIVDDYFSWAGCRRAVEEYRNARKIEAPITPIDKQSAFWRKV